MNRTQKREHTEILNEEEFLDEMNAFCSGILECLYSCLKWNNNYFRELILEYVSLSTLEIDARREFLIRMINIKYSRFQQEIVDKKESILSKDTKDIQKDSQNDNLKDTENNDPVNVPRKNSIERIEETEEIFKRSLNFGILVFNMYQVVMRTEIDDLLTVTSPSTKEVPSNNGELTRDKTMNINDNELSDDLLSDNSMSYCSSKRISLKRGDDDDNIVKNHEEERMKKEESSATLWMDDENDHSEIHTDNMNENYDNSEMSISRDYSMSSVYNFGYDSSFCRNDTTTATTTNEQEDPTASDSTDDFSYHIEDLFNENIIIENNTEPEDENATEIDLLDDFINKSFTSNPSSRRNSMLSLCSLMNDYSVEDGGSARHGHNTTNNSGNNMETHSSNSRRSSRYSLNLSIHSMPCLNTSGHDEHSNNCSHCGCNCTRYNNYSDNLLYVFPSPTSSPTLLTPPASPTFLLNDHDYIPSENPNTSGKCSRTPEMSEDDYSLHNSSFISLNDSCCQPSPSLTSPTTSTNPNNSHLYRQFTPELISPSPIVQSLSVDNIYVNSYGYTCTFNHVNSAPTLPTTQNVSNQHHRDN
ncbi:hypothetical protein PIROE2DRAFT_21410 [Piromyces sp. E2]|nr:hypothetical protein PIROE2DRAFT_21410 [Piromyces sp. E2]|eukprot:OUM58025.1 hypothetical protein PIROE2DRAFT_21410 [Piromyces sp. E2]